MSLPLGLRNPRYTIGYGSDQKYYVEGPAPGGECSYYGGTLYPQYRWDTEKEVERVVRVANLAYREGYQQAQCDMRAALGIKN